MGKDLDLKNRKIIKLSKATNADEATTLGQVEELIENLDSVKSIQFDTEYPTEAITEGKVAWNNHDKTLNIKTPFGTLQLNQEQVLPVKNANPYPLIDGRVVRITGYNGSYYLIDYADNSKEHSASWDGVLTHTIPAYTGTNDDDVIGHMTTNGLVRELDTSTCQENDIVYLGKDGNWTCVKPISPDYVRIIGKIGAVSETTGEIYVRWSNDSIGDVQESFVAMNMPHGIPVSEKENVVITYNSSLRSVTVTGEFYFYFKSKKYIAYFSEGEEIGHENITGIHFIYLIVQNDIPLLVSSMTYLQYGEMVPLAIITYNNSTSDTFWSGADGKLFCERHGCEMDKATHTELHENLGCYATTGFALAGYTAGSGTGGLTANSFSVDTGYVKDEDNWTLLPQLPDNNGVGTNYNIYYKLGSEWRWYKNNLPYLFTNTNIVRNVITAGSGSLVEITNNGYFINMWIVGIPELDKTTGLPTNEGISLIIGQNQYTTLALAQASSFFDLDLSGFPSQEIAPLWQIIFQRQSGYDDNGNCRIESIRRIVGTRYVNGTQATSPSVHNNLSGRSSLDCHPISAITDLQTTLDGKVVGPASSIENSIPVFDGITGKLLKDNTGVSIVSGNIVGSNSSFVISTDSADGADNKRLQIGGGGEAVNTRGAYIEVCGNENAGNEGDLKIIAGNASRGNIRFYTDTSIERMRLEKGGNLGIGTGAIGIALGKVDISNGAIGLVVGADDGVDTRTNSTTKLTRIGMPHYTNAEEPITLIRASAEVADNRVMIGGGTGTMNAATQISFYTAANNTTVTGTERMRIVNDGKVGIGTITPTEKLDVAGNIAVSGSVKIGTNATAASSSNVGAIRYTSTANSSSMEMVMQTGASTYAWVVIKTNTW